MSLALNAAPFLRDETIIEKKNKTSTEDIQKRLRKKNKNKSVTFELNEDNDDDVNELVDFKPLNSKTTNSEDLVSEFPKNVNDDGFAYENIGFFSENYNKKNIVENMTDNVKNNSLEEKVNYLIELLEKQNEKKTEYVTEEIVLYLFLGVFIIYTVDSFTRVTKYTR
jgi:hypothetical protein